MHISQIEPQKMQLSSWNCDLPVAPFTARGLIQSSPLDLKTPRKWCRFAVARGEKGRGGFFQRRSTGRGRVASCRWYHLPPENGSNLKAMPGKGVPNDGAWWRMMVRKVRNIAVLKNMFFFFAVAKTPPSVGWKWWKAVHVLVLNMHDQRRFSVMRRSSKAVPSQEEILRNSTLGSRLKHWDVYRLSHLHPTDFPKGLSSASDFFCQLALRDHQVWMIHCQREIRVVISLGKHMLCPDHPRSLSSKWTWHILGTSPRNGVFQPGL